MNVVVEVADNGVGGADPTTDPASAAGGRVEALGGSLEVVSPAGGGTALPGRDPLPEAADASPVKDGVRPGGPRARTAARSRRLRPHDHDHSPSSVPDRRRPPDPVRRQRRRAEPDAAAHQPLAREPVRVRAVWAALAEHARLFAVDLPGFGASERRDDLLSPRAMGGFLARLIAEADLGSPHIVAPDVGPRRPCSRRRPIRSGSRA